MKYKTFIMATVQCSGGKPRVLVFTWINLLNIASDTLNPLMATALHGYVRETHTQRDGEREMCTALLPSMSAESKRAECSVKGRKATLAKGQTIFKRGSPGTFLAGW